MLTDEQREAIIDEFLRKTLRDLEDRRVKTGYGMLRACLDDNDLQYDRVDQTLEMYAVKTAEMQKDLADNNLKPYEFDADEFFRETGVTIEREGFDYVWLCRERLKATIKAFEIETERARGNYNNPYDRWQKLLGATPKGRGIKDSGKP